ncbi:hypothetical protein ABID95_000322 [Streptomyces atratus]
MGRAPTPMLSSTIQSGVGGRRSGALLPLLLPLLDRRDGLADALHPHGVPGPQGAEARQIGRQIGHAFDCSGVGAAEPPPLGQGLGT